MGSEAAHDAEPADAARRLADVVAGVFSSLEETALAFAGLVTDATTSGRRLRRSDLGSLRPLLLRHLQQHEELIMGTGVVIAPDLLADAPLWLEWWRAAPGKPSALRLDLDPTSVGFYDYTRADWYVGPRRGAARAVVGPFVDFGGTNEYTLALTVPVKEQDSFLGVAGADLWATRIEAIARRLMRGLDRDVVLVNADGRILASRSPRRLIGSLAQESEVAARYPLPGLPWALVGLG